MKRLRWSRLYPRNWQREFGEEFDAMNESAELRLKDMADIVWSALRLHMNGLGAILPGICAWMTVAFFNVVAKEVQWAAGSLLLCCAVAAFRRPNRWFSQSIWFFLSIPISTLYFYQIPGVKHEPLFHTIVALIPAMIGSLMGLMVRFAFDPPSTVNRT